MARRSWNSFQQHNLTSDIPGSAAVTDPDLVDPWGAVRTEDRRYIWIALNGTDLLKLYDEFGSPLNRVTVTGGAPTGVVRNNLITCIGGTCPEKPKCNCDKCRCGCGRPDCDKCREPPGGCGNCGNCSRCYVVCKRKKCVSPDRTGPCCGKSIPIGFPITVDAVTRPSRIIVVTENGTIEGWNPEVSPTATVIAVSSPGSVFKGAALHGGLLYVTEFISGNILVYDYNWNLVKTFTDPALVSAGYGAFNVYWHDDRLYVSFALRSGEDDLPGLGNGYIQVYCAELSPDWRFASRGPLNSPWGMLAKDGLLYVGNNGDGRINIYDIETRQFLSPLRDLYGNPVDNDGLWSILNDSYERCGKCEAAIFFAAGSQNGDHGLTGRLIERQWDV